MTIDFSALLLSLQITYSLIICSFTLGILLLSSKRDKKQKPISVIVAARNEEKHILELIRAISLQNYPAKLFELIIIDDRSTDTTFKLISEQAKQYKWIKVLQVNEESKKLVGKKGALNAGIMAAKYEILAFTDADCIPQKKWLSSINALMTDDTDFLCGYSPLISENNLLNGLKNLERGSIFAVIAGSFGLNWGLTSVARNQVYRKSIFIKMGGFQEIGHIRSGDDDLMLQKMTRYLNKRKFIFAKDAEVPSYDKSSVTEMAELETRRASKWKYYPLSVKLMTLIILIYYIMLIAGIPAVILGNITWNNYLMSIISKLIVEFLLLLTFLSKIRKLSLLKYFPLAELVYIPYFIYFGLKGTFGKYSWKN